MISEQKNCLSLGGTAVDPDSGLDDVAHVHKSRDGVKYSVVLGLTDIVSKKNSFYKLQVLEADSKNKYVPKLLLVITSKCALLA